MTSDQSWRVTGRVNFSFGHVDVPGSVATPAAGPRSTEEWAAQAICEMEAGNFEAAVVSWRHAIARDDTKADSHHNLGDALANLGWFEEAAASYHRAITLDDTRAGSHYNLGLMLAKRGLDEEAADSYRMAIALDDNRGEFHNNLGNRLLALGRYEDAAASFRRGIALLDTGFFSNNLGLALDSLGQHVEAAASYRRAIAFDDTWADFHSNLGAALAHTGRFEEAAASYRRAIALEDTRALFHSNLGAALQDLGRLEEAVTSFRTAIGLDGGVAPPHLYLGRALLSLDRIGEARSSLVRSLELDPDLPEAHAVFAHLLERLGRHDLAAAAWQRALVAGAPATFFGQRRDAMARAWRALEAAQEVAAAGGGRAAERAAWRTAGEHYRRLAEVTGWIRRQIATPDERADWQGEVQGRAAEGAYAFVRAAAAGDAGADGRAAAELIEGGQATMLGDHLGLVGAAVEMLRAQGHAAEAARFVAARDGYMAVARFGAGSAGSRQRQRLTAARSELDAAIAAVQELAGHERFLSAPDWEEIAAASQACPLVYLASCAAGGVVLVVWRGAVVVAEDLPALSSAALNGRIAAYLDAYATWRRALAGGAMAAAVDDGWRRALEDLLAWLWPAAMGRVVAALAELGQERAVVIASGLLGLLPLHAARAWRGPGAVPAGAQPGDPGWRYVLDEVCLSYAASARSLTVARQRAAAFGPPRRALAVHNPAGSPALRHAAAEAGQMGAAYATTELSGADATVEGVLAAMQAHAGGVVALAVHGSADLANPLQGSGVDLAGGRRLTVGEVQRIQGSGGWRLLCLTGCETAQIGTTLPDEAISLPTAFSQVGAAGVVASLWAVDDARMPELMGPFHRACREEADPARALWQAQRAALGRGARQPDRDSGDSGAAAARTGLPPQRAGRPVGAAPARRAIADYTWAALVFHGA